jgi:glycosyltransferase involved in cell wall biosynthesis
VKRRLAHALDRRFEALHHRLEGVTELRGEVAALRAELAALAQRLDADLLPVLRLLAGRDAENRRLLAAARADRDYELAFSEADPLVTIVLPTYRRAELLRTRSLPAALAQTHQRVEVLVIGDGPDPESEAIVREAGDERARWTNLPQRYVYPDADRHWLAVSTLTRNEGYRLASGRWLFDFDDDDSLPPNAVELLLETARERRAEAVQGVLRELHPDGSSRDELAVLPDRLPLKGALVHSHLRFFERDHVASALGIAGDWFRGERMLRAGVRIELVDQITYDYYPSSLWSS